MVVDEQDSLVGVEKVKMSKELFDRLLICYLIKLSPDLYDSGKEVTLDDENSTLFRNGQMFV